MSVPRRTLLAALPLLVAGCSTPLRTPPLALTPRQALQWRSFVDEQLRGQIALGEVQGADEPAVGFLQQALAFVWGSPVDGQVVLSVQAREVVIGPAGATTGLHVSLPVKP